MADQPGGYGLLKLVIGHKSVQTTEKFYSGLETGPAMAAFDEIVRKAAERRDSVAGTPQRRRGHKAA